MNSVICFLVITFNVLSGLVDPFEFDGDYGKEINPIREKVFKTLLLEETFVQNYSKEELQEKSDKPLSSQEEIESFRQELLQQAKSNDLQRGPTLAELLPTDLLTALKEKQIELTDRGFPEKPYDQFIEFYDKYKDQKIFAFFKHSPEKFLSLDKELKSLHVNDPLPIVGSTQILSEKAYPLLSKDLLDKLFTEEHISLAKPEKKLKKGLEEYKTADLHLYLGEKSSPTDLELFVTPTGQLIYYWMYESLHLHLIAEDSPMIPQVNKVKSHFAKTLADPVQRVSMIKSDLTELDPGLLFLQECDPLLLESLLKDSSFLPIEGQNSTDGTVVLLGTDIWESEYEIIPLNEYAGYKDGKVNIVLAKQKQSNIPFLLASCHGNSQNAEDGREQISLVMSKFTKLKKKYPDLQLLIGIDANTKSDKDVEDLYNHLGKMHLVYTKIGPTTIKRRMLTVQQSKAGKKAIDQEDYIITLDNTRDRLAMLSQPFLHSKDKELKYLPNSSNFSDHYPVGAYIIPVNESEGSHAD